MPRIVVGGDEATGLVAGDVLLEALLGSARARPDVGARFLRVVVRIRAGEARLPEHGGQQPDPVSRVARRTGSGPLHRGASQRQAQ